MSIEYYMRSQEGLPFLSEIKLLPLYAAEEFLINFDIASENYFSKGIFPDAVRIDRNISIEKRHFCEVHNVYLYEIFYNKVPPIAISQGVSPRFATTEIYYINCCASKGSSIAISVGKRSENINILRLSNFPHVASAFNRVAGELGVDQDGFAWRVGDFQQRA